jgi:RNA polymerase sigma-70 factor (ECF subfamily)
MSTERFEDLRPLAFAIAYRMLGSVSDAEDAVQEAFLKLVSSEPEELRSARAYLATVVSRVAIDHLRAARTRRETYPGPWLPEPLIDAPAETTSALADSLSMAFLVLLESLSPVERAVFLLHDVFEMDYPEVAEIVGKSEVNCRQIAARARQQLEEKRPRFRPDPEDQQRLAARFLAAAWQGDLAGLSALLAEDATFHGDGGGKGRGLLRPVLGREAVERVVLGIFAGARKLGLRLEPVTVNGGPGALVRDGDGALINVFSLETAAGVVRAVRSVINPDKLGHLGPLSPLAHRREP